jgi:ADP-heptose:LPS heptosyltransferase
MQAERFDLALQMHGSGPFVNPLIELLGARQTAGFFLPGNYCPNPRTYLPWPDRDLEIRRLLELTDFLGCPRDGEHLEFPLGREDHAAARRALAGRALSAGQYVCIHVGASVPERRWPLERFVDIGSRVAAAGFQVVLTGSASEGALTRTAAAAIGATCSDLAGRTGLGALAALLAESRLLVCNDTGVSHLAAALRVPSVVIATGDNPARWAPIDRVRHRVLCARAGVTAHEVMREVNQLLQSFGEGGQPAPGHGPALLANAVCS